MTLVSVLTPSYNQSAWLKDNLLSVENQTYPRIEHIVMDGGSTDDSVRILQQSGESIRWWSEPDRGQSHALNKAFEKSRGEIIGWLNSDDAYADRRAVEAAVRAFEDDPSIGVVYGHSVVVNARNRILHPNWAPQFSRSAFEYVNFFVQPAAFIRRSVIEAPLVDESLHYVMDRNLWLRLVDRTRFKRIDMIVGVDRFQPHRKTLEGGYPQEARAHMLQRGIDVASVPVRARVQALKIMYRLRGAPLAATLGSRLEPAIPLRIDPSSRTIIRQVAVRRRSMPVS
jgi:glycosyltransferase involved in cell wall biosynthesis